MSNVIEIDVGQIEALAKRLSRVDGESLGKASVRALNTVVHRGFDNARRAMLSGVNLPESYVKERMTVEEAADIKQPVAKIIAFRPGGQRRPGIRPVNLRQYDPKLTITTNNWSNSGVATDSGRAIFAQGAGKTPRRKGGVGPNPKDGVRFYENPRKPGSKLPFIPRVGNKVLGIPVGQKVESISVEVIRGQRKLLRPVRGFAAFMQRMPNGQILVMRRVDKNGGKDKKGKIEALYSLSVAQLFFFAAKKDNESAQRFRANLLDDLVTTVTDEVLGEIKEVVNL